MAQITTIITRRIDLDSGVGPAEVLRQHLVYSNANAHEFRLICMRGQQQASLSGAVCTGYVRRKDGLTIPVPGQISGCTASIRLTAPCYAVPGCITISIELSEGDTRATHAVFLAQVDRTTTEEVGGEAAVAISEALERILSADSPDWAQNDPDSPDHIRSRTHFRTRKHLSCTDDLGVTDGWRMISADVPRCSFRQTENTASAQKVSVFAEADGIEAELALDFAPGTSAEDALPTGDTFGQARRTFGRLRGTQTDAVMFVHEAIGAFSRGTYLRPEAIAPQVFRRISWYDHTPLDDAYIPDTIARRSELSTLCAPPIVATAKGLGFVFIEGASNRPLAGLRIFGRTQQNADPTPDAPVELVHVGASRGQITVAVNDDRAIVHVDGGLAGIPIDSEDAGNFVDSSGQRWICDEIDFARGVRIQRVARIVCGADNAEYFADGLWQITSPLARTTEPMAVMSSHYKASGRDITPHGSVYVNLDGKVTLCNDKYTSARIMREDLAVNPVTVLYELPTPIETPLDDLTLAEFASFRTHASDQTTILNTAAAEMEAAYIADTKHYIDAQIAALAGH